MTHAQARRARRFLIYDGIPAHQVADIVHCSVDEVRNARIGLGRDGEHGGPISRHDRIDDSTSSFGYFDAMMRSNRGVGL